MGFMDKLKNIFFEEEEEDDALDTPKVEKEVVIKKVEIPKRSKPEVYEPISKEEEKIEEKEQPKENKTPVVEPKTVKKERQQDILFDDEDFILETPKPKRENRSNLEFTKTEVKETIKEAVKKEPTKYEYSKQEETKRVFTPSPIISPIYGILDKNYKKEEVKEKKEIRISSRPAKVDFDSVRNKAFGDLENELFPEAVEDTKEEKKEEVKPREFSRIYDMSDKKEKPSIEKVTIGEADEYFNDLGLAYNTDYKDVSKEISDGKIQEKKTTKEGTLEDNLFDLIESMYDKED